MITRHALTHLFRHIVDIRHNKDRIRLTIRAPHPAAQLVQLSQPEHLGLIDYQRVGPGKIQPGLHNGRTDQHIKLTVPEPVHGVFQLFFPHLAMSHADAGLRHQIAHEGNGPFHLLHPVVHPEDLSFAGDFPLHDLAQRGRVTVHEHACHGFAFSRGGFNDRKLADAGHGKLKRAGNGSGRQRQGIHILSELFGAFPCDAPRNAAPRPE